MSTSSPKKKTKIFAFDVDGVICATENGDYAKSIPNQKAIEKINKIYAEGKKVIIFYPKIELGKRGNCIQSLILFVPLINDINLSIPHPIPAVLP